MSDFRMPPAQSYNERYWEAANEGALVIQHCPGCDMHVFPPRAACPECFDDMEWAEAAGTGTLYSFTVVHHPDPPAAVPDDKVPFLGCIVELDEGVRIASHLVNCDRDDASVGMKVSVTFRETPDGRTIPAFEPV